MIKVKGSKVEYDKPVLGLPYGLSDRVDINSDPKRIEEARETIALWHAMFPSVEKWKVYMRAKGFALEEVVGWKRKGGV